MTVRTEHDQLGQVEVPADAYHGVHTARALVNFPRLGVRVGDVAELASALAMVKLAAARANVDLGVLPPDVAAAIIAACEELVAGERRLRDALAVALVQGGAGTSTNMNVNEVLANRALEHLGYPCGAYEHCHPNDHVNRSQSTNDVYPTALRLAVVMRNEAVIAELAALAGALREQARRHRDLPKLARTQLQDAVPMTVGQEFDAWADGCAAAASEIGRLARRLLEVNLGGTAVGTGLGAPEGYPDRAIEHLREITGRPLRLAARPVSATTDGSALLAASAGLREAAVAIGKLAGDLRLLASGPRTALDELTLPAVQAGSSMMPGKVNPVIPEFATQLVLRVHGLDATAVMALSAGELQLNAMTPVAAGALFEAQDLIACACRTLRDRCVEGIEVHRSIVRTYAEQGLGELSELAGSLGYAASSALVAKARAAGVAPVELAREIHSEGVA